MCDNVRGPLAASLLSITVFRSLTKRSVDRKVKFGEIVFQTIIVMLVTRFAMFFKFLTYYPDQLFLFNPSTSNSALSASCIGGFMVVS